MTLNYKNFKFNDTIFNFKSKMNTQNILIVVVLILMTSCTANYLITVRENGSAIVNIDRDFDLKDINRYYKSNIISNIDTNVNLASRVTFEISSIDSLGTYLPFHPPGFFRFRMNGDTLIVTDGNTNAFKFEDPFCCGLFMSIKFDKDILSVKSVNRNASQKDKRTILIGRSRRQLIKSKRKLDVIIKTLP